MPDQVNPPVPDKPLSRFEAQRKLGLFAPHDDAMLVLILLCWVTMGFWALFGQPSVYGLIAAALFTLLLTQLWLIVLAYRILVFILDVQADINLMPEAAARIVVGFYQGNKK